MRFAFRWLPTVATLLGLAIFVSLGVWQHGKGERLAAELALRQARHALGATRVDGTLVDAEALRNAPVVVQGVYEAQHQFFVDNRQLDGQPGVHVITPLRIDGSAVRILVNRGWVGWTLGRGVLPVVDVPAGLVTVRGLADVPSTKKFFLMPETAPDRKLWPRVDLARFASESGNRVQPVVLLQNADDAQDRLVRRWEPPQDRVAKHQGYAFQWFGMALALLIFYLLTSVKSKVNP